MHTLFGNFLFSREGDSWLRLFLNKCSMQLGIRKSIRKKFPIFHALPKGKLQTNQNFVYQDLVYLRQPMIGIHSKAIINKHG